MRARRFDYYGRPCRQPYIIDSAEEGPATHVCCMSRSEWDESRVRALQVSRRAPPTDRALALQRLQRETNGANGWDRPVLTHGDLSDRNILVDPDTLAITGFIDWETEDFLPAYFDYVAARLSSGHQPEWRVELLDVLRLVLRRECEGDAECAVGYGHVGSEVEAGEMYKRTTAAWDAVVDVERCAQGLSDDCYWTFEPGLSRASAQWGEQAAGHGGDPEGSLANALGP
ncbi:hypothetical protein OH76DRAFT_1399846 [Lentinus brumalis]|uniref:Aminoglycoside phosphotransferase domain-containing protein n=1 Tax=Lentinus brumalis TaxID=2498619 RepID=A0A371DL11_9APHY|nr:hypothetical protein OH76DRAFT_1399846 [Polyporus brumalis]